MTNVIEAIYNLIDQTFSVMRDEVSLNRMNRQGESLESFIKGAFCPIPDGADPELKQRLQEEVFSYLGNQNNPPDFMLRGGDAVEVKKTEGRSGRISLNSSFPKRVLRSTSNMITQACRDAEKWETKDNLYVIGEMLPDQSLQHLWFVYGDCFAAEEATYESIRTVIRDGVSNLNLELSESNELGRVNRVDPLGVTNLRIRGMWDIAGPRTVFHGLYDEIDSRPSIFAVMSKQKYLSFSYESRERLQGLADKNVKIEEVRLRNPDNPVELVEAVTISWTGI